MALTTLPQFAYPSNGWWVVRNTDGSIGLVKGNNPGSGAITSVYVGAANSVNALASNLGTKLSNAIGQIGATATQQATLISVIDTSAGKNSTAARITVAANPAPGTNTGATAADAQGNPISTVPSGDAAAAGIGVPTGVLGAVTQIWAALSNPQTWLRALEILGAAVAIYLGVRGLAGGYGS